MLLCINTGKFRTDKQRMRMEGDQFYLRSAEEMHAALGGHEDALRQSQAIADSVDIQLDLGQRHFPTYKLPPERTAPDFLHELCVQGLRERLCRCQLQHWVDGSQLSLRLSSVTPTTAPSVINKLGFPNYFLIVWDFVRYSRERGIPATARGSGVGSLVSYMLLS